MIVLLVVGGLGGGDRVAAVRGDEAEHTCYYHAQHVRRGLPGGEKFLGGGRYDDRLRRTPDGWKFTRRLITSVWSEGNPAVLTSLGASKFGPHRGRFPTHGWWIASHTSVWLAIHHLFSGPAGRSC